MTNKKDDIEPLLPEISEEERQKFLEMSPDDRRNLSNKHIKMMNTELLKSNARLEKEAKNELIEKVADFMHDQWSHWTDYFILEAGIVSPHSTNEDMLSIHFKREDIFRWQKQIKTPYAELSEKEKDSDREWARKLLEVLK